MGEWGRRNGDLEKLLKLKARVDWSDQNRRHDFLDDMLTLVRNWKDEHPDLHRVFRTRQMDYLLGDVVYCIARCPIADPRERLIDFVVGCGYTDEPERDHDGRPVLQRTTAIHVATEFYNFSLFAKLFRIYHRYDLNYVDAYGMTHFHAACKAGLVEVVRRFLRWGLDPNSSLLPGSGEPPLHLVVQNENADLMELLLEHGADPGRVNHDKSTPLHLISASFHSNELMERFFKANDDLNLIVDVNARDRIGRSALHLVLAQNNVKLMRLLMRRGANPNSIATTDRDTPLHVICRRNFDDALASVFFEEAALAGRRVDVNVVDREGMTPLQVAVSKFLPSTVGLLLEHDADLESFVFPKPDSFQFSCSMMAKTKLRVSAGAMGVLGILADRDWEMDQGDAMTLMSFFASRCIFARSEEVLDFWRDNEPFCETASTIMVTQGEHAKSLYDLVRMSPKKAEKLVDYSYYFNFARDYASWNRLPRNSEQACAASLCEKVTRRFFLEWAVDPFMQLIGCRVPPEVAEIILAKGLVNSDLYNVCLAATGKNA